MLGSWFTFVTERTRELGKVERYEILAMVESWVLHKYADVRNWAAVPLGPDVILFELLAKYGWVEKAPVGGYCLTGRRMAERSKEKPQSKRRRKEKPA